MKARFTWKHGALFAILAAVLLWRFDAVVAVVLLVAIGCCVYVAIRSSSRDRKG